MSDRKQKIIQALESKGYVIEYIAWEPIGKAMEMCGPSGGWYVEIDINNDVEVFLSKNPNVVSLQFDHTLLGYNFNEVLEEIERLPNLRDILKAGDADAR